jgi:tetratricopeptide (TPR) repeat protein
VSGAARRSARAALDAVRPAIARLDQNQSAEDLAADLIESWRGAETALRALVGGSALAGQALIREARVQQVIDFDKANALAEFNAAHDRLEDTAYRPSEADVAAARRAYLKLDAALMGDGLVEPPVASPETAPPSAAQRMVQQPQPSERTYTVEVSSPTRGWSASAILLVILLSLAVLGTVGYYVFRPRTYEVAMDRGTIYYRAGQREAAIGEFNKAVRTEPGAALPHVYLARMAREVGNFTLAMQELQLALQAEPGNEVALREMGSALLAAGNYELASKFYIRAVQSDSTDKMAQGYLGCTLMRLGKPDVAARFLARAGQGPWTACTGATTPDPR